MKNILLTLTLFACLSIPLQGAYAWTYQGINSLNPFTGFKQCKCVKIEKCKKVEKCKRQKLTKCQKLHGMKRGITGCAAPISE